MRTPIVALAALAAFACLATTGLAQDATRSAETVTTGAVPAGEEAMDDVDPAVLERCRRQADEQKLKDGPVRRAFMGTCVTPED